MGSQAMMFAPRYSTPSKASERKGVVYTKPWVVDLLLDLAGYVADADLVKAITVEPAAGDGAFLVRMAGRLISSCRRRGYDLEECRNSIVAFELDDATASNAKASLVAALTEMDVDSSTASNLASAWIRTGDYLFEAFQLEQADFVIGNPPYVRLEDIPEEVAGMYRQSYSTMTGRADLYVAFYEASLSQLKPNGVCAFICADRWMLNQYGAQLRGLVTSGFAVEAIIEMHKADAFHDEVSAYPAITVIRRGAQGPAVVATALSGVEEAGGNRIAEALEAARSGKPRETIPGLSAAIVPTWFKGIDPWPCSSPRRLALLRRLEEQYEPLESQANSVKVGIGVATGLDEVFITRDNTLVERSRLIPLALAKDTLTGHLNWSGHYLVDPWTQDGLVDLEEFPKLARYLGQHEALVKRRNTAQKNPNGWYRTIDRVTHSLIQQPKLYIPDIKDEFNPVLDRGETYPHHNLYFVQSDVWDLEVLGGILLSAVGQFFVECYGVRMRGGYLRFQAQYLRRIRIPNPEAVSVRVRKELISAFRKRDRDHATEVALELYQIDPSEMETTLGL
ncbi:MAG: N-6 DNA methylase [Bryobacteraceae bacterium]